MNPLKAVAVAMVREHLKREQRRKELVAKVMLDFELDPKACARRHDVHTSLARRLNVSVSNELAVSLHNALDLMPGVHMFTRCGRQYYRGLKARPERVPTPEHANSRKRARPESIERMRQAQLRRWAAHRARKQQA